MEHNAELRQLHHELDIARLKNDVELAKLEIKRLEAGQNPGQGSTWNPFSKMMSSPKNKSVRLEDTAGSTGGEGTGGSAGEAISSALSKLPSTKTISDMAGTISKLKRTVGRPGENGECKQS
jgi:hypothetical protein